LAAQGAREGDALGLLFSPVTLDSALTSDPAALLCEV